MEQSGRDVIRGMCVEGLKKIRKPLLATVGVMATFGQETASELLSLVGCRDKGAVNERITVTDVALRCRWLDRRARSALSNSWISDSIYFAK